MKKLKWSVLSVVAFVAISGCGSKAEVSEQRASTLTSAPIFSTSPNGVGQDMTALNDNARRMILGNYGGTIVKVDEYTGAEVSQPYTFTVGQQTLNQNGENKTYATLQFRSTGSIGNLSHDYWLAMTAGAILNSYTNSIDFSFRSDSAQIDALSDSPIALDLYLVIRGGTQLDAASSHVKVKDCGFSGGYVCSNDLQTVYFRNDLRKL